MASATARLQIQLGKGLVGRWEGPLDRCWAWRMNNWASAKYQVSTSVTKEKTIKCRRTLANVLPTLGVLTMDLRGISLMKYLFTSMEPAVSPHAGEAGPPDSRETQTTRLWEFTFNSDKGELSSRCLKYGCRDGHCRIVFNSKPE